MVDIWGLGGLFARNLDVEDKRKGDVDLEYKWGVGSEEWGMGWF